MVNDVVQQIVDLASVNINITLIVVLLAVGFALKHLIKTLDNTYIPIILGIIAIVLEIVMNVPFDPQVMLLQLVVEAIISTFFATVIHSKGKEIFTSISNKNSSSTTEDQNSDSGSN